jgi:hypothetical protein
MAENAKEKSVPVRSTARELVPMAMEIATKETLLAAKNKVKVSISFRMADDIPESSVMTRLTV